MGKPTRYFETGKAVYHKYVTQDGTLNQNLRSKFEQYRAEKHGGAKLMPIGWAPGDPRPASASKPKSKSKGKSKARAPSGRPVGRPCKKGSAPASCKRYQLDSKQKCCAPSRATWNLNKSGKGPYHSASYYTLGNGKRVYLWGGVPSSKLPKSVKPDKPKKARPAKKRSKGPSGSAKRARGE